MDILPYTEDHRIFRDALRKFFAKEVETPHRGMGRSGNSPAKRVENHGGKRISVHASP